MKIEVILLYLLYIIFILAIILLIKNGVTYTHMSRILNAIHVYNMREIDESFNENRPFDIIPYDCFKSYETVLFNVFDWGIENIIPKEYYERVKPYL